MGQPLIALRAKAAAQAFRLAARQGHRTGEDVLSGLSSELGAAPVVVDVGANVGRWSLAVLDVFPQAIVVAIEAQPELCARLDRLARRRPGMTVLNEVLDVESAEKTFYVCHGDRHRTGSSLRPELTGARIEARTVRTTTLDDVVESLRLPRWPDLVKLDTQGTELEILASGEAVLDHARFVQLELSLITYNQGAPVLADSIEWMAARGFHAYEFFAPTYLATGEQAQIDCLFARGRRRVDAG